MKYRTSINKFLHKRLQTPNATDNKQLIPSQMQPNYEIKELTIKDLIYNSTKCVDDNKRLNINIYYKNNNLIMKNNLRPNTPMLHQTIVVYEFICPYPECKPDHHSQTSTTLCRRIITMHLKNGSIKQHFMTTHQTPATNSLKTPT